MTKYGQYCPIAQALELLGDRWTLLIIRDMLTGTTQFNDLQRGLPGLSRALLAKRLQQLQDAEIIIKHRGESGRQSTSYHLTESGQELQAIINSLLVWGARWAFSDPSPEDLDPLLLMWWMKNRVNSHVLPDNRVVVQFNFFSTRLYTYWLVLAVDDVTICLTDPGYDVDIWVKTELATYFKLWLGRITYSEAIREYGVEVEGMSFYVQAFPNWFAWSPAASTVRSMQAAMPAKN